MARILSMRARSRPPRRHDELPVADDLVERSGLTVPWVAVSVGVFMYAAMVVSFAVDYGPRFDWLMKRNHYWTGLLEGPLLLAYLLLAHRLLDVYGCRVIKSIRPLVAVDDSTFNDFLARNSRSLLRFQWLAMLAALVLVSIIQDIWSWQYYKFIWSLLVPKIGAVALYTLLASLLYLAVARYILFTRLYRQPLRLDIFDLAPLRPVAQWGLSISASLAGGVTLSILFTGTDRVGNLFSGAPITTETIEQVLLYSVVLLTAVLLFFGSLISTHAVMLRAKERELRVVHDNLSATYIELKERTSRGRFEGMEQLSRTVAAWLAYERRIQEVPTWPYTANTLGGLFASVVLPVVIGITQQIMFWR